MREKLQNDLQTRLPEVTEKLMAELLPVLILYYPIFAAQHCTGIAEINAIMNQFAERMLVEQVTRKGFVTGLEKLKKRAGSAAFILNPQAFAELCKPSDAELGLPEFQTVLEEIIQRRGKERFNQEWQFSHELIRLINNRKGDLIYQQTSIEFERTIKAEYDHWLKRIAAGEVLPEPLLAIEQKPEMPDYLKGVKPSGKMAQRVEQMRQMANERKAAEQLASVHKA